MQKAFTLVEVIIVVAILGVVLQIVASILVTIMRQQTAIIRFGDVKKEGDQIIERMKSEIYNRTANVTNGASTELCTYGSDANMTTSGFFVDSQSTLFRFYQSGNRIVMSNGASSSYLNSTKTKITASSLVVRCSRRGQFSNRLVLVSFDIESVVTAMQVEGNPTLHYSTLIMLKN